METQDQLVKKAKRGDKQAFAELYSMIYKDLYRFALYTLGREQDAQDAVSETVVDAYTEIGSLRNPDAFRAWIFRILSNKCKRVLKTYANATAELPEDLPVKETDYAEIHDVRNAFKELTEQERMIINLTVFAGYSNGEAALIMNMKSGTLRSIKSRAYDKMEVYLKGGKDHE